MHRADFKFPRSRPLGSDLRNNSETKSTFERAHARSGPNKVDEGTGGIKRDDFSRSRGAPGSRSLAPRAVPNRRRGALTWSYVNGGFRTRLHI